MGAAVETETPALVELMSTFEENLKMQGQIITELNTKIAQITGYDEPPSEMDVESINKDNKDTRSILDRLIIANRFHRFQNERALKLIKHLTSIV